MKLFSKKVYVVTAGCYSDYRIIGLFSTKQKAEEFCDKKDFDYDITAYELDTLEAKAETGLFSVGLEVNTKRVVTCQKFDPEHCYYERDTIEYYDRQGTPTLYFYIEGDSVKRVTKIASERFGAVIANEQAMYPRLRQEILEGKSYTNSHPIYDFNTGEIVLDEGDEFVDEIYDLSFDEMWEMDDDERRQHLPKDIRVRYRKNNS